MTHTNKLSRIIYEVRVKLDVIVENAAVKNKGWTVLIIKDAILGKPIKVNEEVC